MINPYIVVPVAVWAIAQFLKFVIAASHGRLDFKYLYASGGMPSVHAAVVTSLSTTAFLIDGPTSAIFGITVILAGIVMYDSFGVRRSSGEQAVAINHILASLDKDRAPMFHQQEHIREVLGHKPSEVIVGASLGTLLAVLFNIDRAGLLLATLSTPVPFAVTLLTAALSAILLVGVLAGRIWLLKKYAKVTAVKTVVKRVFIVDAVFASVGLALAFLQYEKIEGALWVVWPLVLLLTLAVIKILILRAYKQPIREALAAHKARLDKQKWIEGPNKDRRKKKKRK
ncbi:MAG TPA: divergent PAP2 family protein [Candidatus Dormibacteraeota bacterium]|nr:divergent PAP2 family protein [Candidatus Dormibacteraeota bacterium]